MATIRAFCPQIRALFSNFQKRAGETYPLPPSNYAPEFHIKIHMGILSHFQGITEQSC